MNALTRSLRDEHTLIRRALACLDRLVDEAWDRDDTSIALASDLLEFFEHFADGLHQEKEERHLFPALVASGVAEARVHALQGEHAKERAALAAMRGHLEGAAYGDGLSRDAFVTCARRLARLQREHAAAEDAVLLPLAEELMSDEAGRRALAGARETEAELLPRPARHYLELVERAEKAIRNQVCCRTPPRLTGPATGVRQ